MTGVREVKNKKQQVTQVVITFSGAVNGTEAQNTTLYRLAYPGKKGSYTAKNAQVIKLKSAVYKAASDTVTLTPKKAFALTSKVQLVVNGVPPSGLEDSYGRYIDGDHNGTAGGNAIAILAKKSVLIDADVSERVEVREPLDRAVIVDAVLSRGDLADFRHPLRDRLAVRL